MSCTCFGMPGWDRRSCNRGHELRGKTEPGNAYFDQSFGVGYLTLGSSRHSGISMQFPVAEKNLWLQCQPPQLAHTAYHVTRLSVTSHQPPVSCTLISVPLREQDPAFQSLQYSYPTFKIFIVTNGGICQQEAIYTLGPPPQHLAFHPGLSLSNQ